MNKPYLDCYNPSACCDTDCNLLGSNPEEPCWGDVSVVDEVEDENGDYVWVHSCSGHWDSLYDSPGITNKYNRKPTDE